MISDHIQLVLSHMSFLQTTGGLLVSRAPTAEVKVAVENNKRDCECRYEDVTEGSGCVDLRSFAEASMFLFPYHIPIVNVSLLLVLGN